MVVIKASSLIFAYFAYFLMAGLYASFGQAFMFVLMALLEQPLFVESVMMILEIYTPRLLIYG